MSGEGRPDPISKAAASSNLPRTAGARARVGMTTDPVPEGKELAAAPEKHFSVEPASHDAERSQPKSPSEMGLTERDSHMKELAKTHAGDEMKHRNAVHRKDVQAGMDWMGTSTATNKLMDSRHRTNDYQATGRGQSKHHDSVTRSGH